MTLENRMRLIVAAGVGFAVLLSMGPLLRADDPAAAKKALETAAGKIKAANEAAEKARKDKKDAITALSKELEPTTTQDPSVKAAPAASVPRFNLTPVATPRAAAAGAPVGFAFPVPDQNPA